MRLLAKCPDCTRTLTLTLADADRRKRCPSCNRLFRVPDAESLRQAIALVQSAQGDVYVDEKGNVYG